MSLHSTALFDDLTHLPAGQVIAWFGPEQLTAGVLRDQAQQQAAALHHAGFREGNRAVLIVAPGPEMLTLLYALMLAGGLVALIDPEMGRQHFEAKLQQFDPRWAFVDSRLVLLQEHPLIRWAYLRFAERPFYFAPVRVERLVTTGPWLPLVRRHQSLRALVKRYPEPVPLAEAADPAQEFLVTYTSGTLAEPKGVVHTLASLAAAIGRIRALLGAAAGQVIGSYLPPFVLMGVSAGIPVRYYPKTWSAAQKLAFFAEHQVSILFGPPSDYLPLVEHAEQAGQPLPACLQHLILGSAPVHATFLQRLYAVVGPHTRVSCLYGMTENLLVARLDGREKIAFSGAGDVVGWPEPGVELRLAPDGEIMLRSPQLFRRYLHEPDRPDWHATGDLGYLSPEGLLVLNGRKKDMIIRRDTNLYPALYEPTIQTIPGVREAVLLGLYDGVRHDELVILVVEAAADFNLEQLRRQLEQGPYAIDREAQPDHILRIEAVPRAGRQDKIDRRALRAWVTEQLQA